jgi:hypothetical protein
VHAGAEDPIQDDDAKRRAGEIICTTGMPGDIFHFPCYVSSLALWKREKRKCPGIELNIDDVIFEL